MRLRRLAITLSKLDLNENPDSSLEQYFTPGEIASRWLSDIRAFGDISPGCRIADLGAGNGILGIGAAIMGAGFVTFIDVDQEMCKLIAKNSESTLQAGSYEIMNIEIGKEDPDLSNIDLVISNPPWGRQTEGADSHFLDLISTLGVTAHLMHSSDAQHIKNRFENMGWNVEKYGEADFPIPASYAHHKKTRGSTRAGFWRLSPP
ncbi:MAG TPA: methyltransferase [Candidatus Thalassarchaeaceae archaeon]|mgnify:FL=1|nr:methyltransferase [Candidatus Thalassarchaeaceae archaeon]